MRAWDKRQPDRAILIPLSSNPYEGDDGITEGCAT